MVFKLSLKGISGVFKVSFKSVSRVLKGNFMGVFIEVIAATRAYGGLVLLNMSRDWTILAAPVSCRG